MLSWSDAALEQRMRDGWSGGLSDGTPCGGGSTRASAAAVAAALPSLVRRYGIESVCDAGAGDLHWISAVDLPGYRAFDLVPRSAAVTKIDIACERLPQCDLVLCRHVLIHFDPDRIAKTLGLFAMAAKYLLANQYDNAPPFDGSQQYNPTDLRPLLGEPIERLQDTGSHLALWKL